MTAPKTESKPASMTALHPLYVIAQKEFRDCVRNFWLLCGTFLFAFLSISLIFGTAAVGGDFNFRPLATVMNSIVSLSVFLIPLIAVLISYDAFAGEVENGTLLLLLTYPVSRSQILLGKLIGQSFALLLCIALGFSFIPLLSLAGVFPYLVHNVCKDLAVLVSTGWLLGVIFILIAYLVSLMSSYKARALGLLLIIWLLLVFFYDLGLLIYAIADSTINQTVMEALMIANPASTFRLINQKWLGVSHLKADYWVPLLYLSAWVLVLFLSDRAIFNRKSV